MKKDLVKEAEKVFKEKDPKMLLIIGAVFILLAMLTKVFLIIGLAIAGFGGWIWYKEQKKK